MTLFWAHGQVVDDQEGSVPEGSIPVQTFSNAAQYGSQDFSWDPTQRHFGGTIEQTSPGYLPMLMQYRDMVQQGTAKDYEAEQYRTWEQAARAIPTRDIGSLTSGWQGESKGQWTDSGWQEGAPDWWTRLDPGSPDAGPIMLSIRDRIDAGTASQQERELYDTTMSMASDWDWRASTPQASDAFNPLGDNLFGALGTLALGATGGLAAAPLAAGGAGLTTTLGSLGTLSGIAGTGASVLGQATDEEWLQRLGLGLGAAGGIAGGVGGLANLWGSGITSLGDVGRLASSAGRVVGGAGTLADHDALRQTGRYLGTAGGLSGSLEGLGRLVGGKGSVSDLLAMVRPLGQVATLARQAGQEDAPAPAPAALRPRPLALRRPVTAQPSAPQTPLPLESAAPTTVAAPGSGSGGILGLLWAAQQAQQRGTAEPVNPSMSPADWLSMRQHPRPRPRTVLGNL